MKTAPTIEQAWDTARQITTRSEFAHVDWCGMDQLAEEISQFASSPESSFFNKLPSGVRTPREAFLYFLLLDSVNFCFWYGWDEVRPNGANSSKLAKLLSEAFLQLKRKGQEEVGLEVGVRFQEILIHERFPLLRERLQHIQQVIDGANDGTYSAIFNSQEQDVSFSDAFQRILFEVPSYGYDMLLKRACLLFQDWWRIRVHFPGCINEMWAEEIDSLPVPIDYHIPNILRYKQVLVYQKLLRKAVDRYDPIPSGSRMEVELRAQSMMICRDLADRSNAPSYIVDQYLFAQRNDALAIHPFHLTTTTDY